VFTSISSSPAKKPVAGSYEFGGSFSSTTSSLEFLGPGRDEVELVLVEVELGLRDEEALEEEDVMLEEDTELEENGVLEDAMLEEDKDAVVEEGGVVEDEDDGRLISA